jgi:hypothetical protein
MDPTTTVRTDALPAAATLLVPAAVAAGPYIGLLWYEPHNLGRVVTALPGASAAAGLIALIGTGFLIESLGSFVEYYCLDRLQAKTQEEREQLTKEWWSYLRTAWKVEPVGQRYLRRLLVTFKFELNLLVACVPCLGGLGALLAWNVVPGVVGYPLMAFAFVLGCYLFFAAYTSAGLLRQVRSELLNGVDAIGDQPER